MTTLKLDSKMTTSAKAAIEPLIGQLYATPGMRVIGVVELAHVDRLQVAPGGDKEEFVKTRIVALEIANEKQEETLRQAMHALHLHRTAYGTVTEDADVELSDRTLEMTGGMLHAIEAARLRTACLHWEQYARKVMAVKEPTTTELLHEIAALADGLGAVLRAVREAEQEEG
jgi:hypothetical protein